MPGDPLTGEILVNSTSTSDQRWPSVTYLENGGFVVVWRDDSQSGGDSSGSAIRAQVHDAFGNPVGAELLINANTGSNQEDPAVSAVSGGFVVTWVDSSGVGGDSSASSVKARIFTSDGTAVGDEFLVNTETTNHQIQPTITVLADGRFVISWADESAIGADTSSYGIKARIFDSEGSPLGGEFLVNSSTAGAQVQPTIAALADGGFAIAWMSATGGGYDVRAQVYDAAGNAAGGELVVNTSVTGGHAEPGIAGLSGGGFVVAWAAAANGDSNVYGVQARVFDGAGNAVTDEFLVNANIAGEQSQPVATGLADGTFVISFVDGFPGFEYEIKAQQFSPDGTAVGTEIHVNTVSAGSQIRPAIATLAGGDFVISWMDDSSGWEIKARVYDGPDASSAPAEAHVDEFTTNELGIVTGNVFADNGFGADSDPDGPALSVAAVNGDPDAVGTQIALPSGALLTLNADGSFIYDPNGAFEQTPTYGSGATNTPSGDFFSYTLAGGDSTIVVFTINGIDNNDVIVGSLENDLLTGGAGNDLIFGDEGNDHLRGNFGNDDLDGGDGFDRVGYFNGATSGVAVDLRISGPQDVGEQGFDTITDVEAVSGTPFADTLTGNDEDNWLWGSISDGGTANNDYLDGQGGNDLLTVGTGNHTIIGGDGNDTLRFTENGNPEVGITVDLFAQGGPQDTGAGSWTISGIENVSGSVENDDLGGDGNANILAGSLGNDVLFGFGGNDTLYGDGAIYVDNQLILRIEVDAGSEGGNDNLDGGGGDDILYGGAGNDVLTGGAGNDSHYGGSGDDLIRGRGGDDLIDGGEGYDRAGYYHLDDVAGGVTVDLNIVGPQDTGSQGWDTLVGIEYVSGTPFADTLIGDGNDNVLWGSVATIDFDSNWISTTNNDTLDGGENNDLLYVGIGNHSLTGGSGIDTVAFTENWGDDPAIHVSLALQGGAQDTGVGLWTLSGIENLSGGNDNDQLAGDENVNVLAGSFGDDTLSGAGGNDSLYGDGAIDTAAPSSGPATLFSDVGANGNDILEGGTGDDLLFGGGGTDTASYANAAGGVSAFLYRNAAGDGESSGADGNDFFESIENLTGSAFSDQLGGNNLDNVLVGGDGDDGLRGNGGNDTLLGGGGNDFLNGSAGDDIVDGGDGTDRAAFYEDAGPAGVTVDLNLQGTAQDTGQGMDTLIGIENVSGSVYGDTLIGDGNDNQLWGSASTLSNGTIVTTNNDNLSGGGGNDLLTIGIGNHVVDGGSGSDTLRFTENGAAETGITVSLSLQGGAQTTGNGEWTLTGIENLSGGTADDSLTGDAGANMLMGDAGNDLLAGGDGNDTLYGDGQINVSGAGSGPITTTFDVGALGDDVLEGGLGDDIVVGGGGIDTASYASATGGIQAFLYGDGFGEAFGAAGYDQLHDIENLTGSAFNDILYGDDANNVVSGGDGHDDVRGFGGDDQIYGGAGDDLLYGNAGNDLLDGGDGIDRVGFYSGATAGVTVDLGLQGVAQDTGQGWDTLVGIENVSGTQFGDTLIGDDGDNVLWGSASTISPGNIATGNNDTLIGNGGNDLLVAGIGNHTIDGGDGIDTFRFTENGAPETGITLSLLIAGAQATANGTWTLTGIENLSGSVADDSLTGDGNANVLAGDLGNDTLVGGAGNDTLYGDGQIVWDGHGTGRSGPITTYVDATGNYVGGVAGNDLLEGGLGNDTLDGGGGIDTASYEHASGGVTVNLGTGFATGADGSDSLVNIENVIGSGFNDNLTGSGGANAIYGLAGNDTISGGAGDDLIDGGDGDDFLQGDLSENNLTAVGNDTIYGGNGNDNLRGGLGNDVMFGGANNDLFRGNGGVDSFDGGADDGEGFNGIGDRVSFFEQRATQGVVADLRTGIISNDGFGNVETMVGIESLGGDTAFVDTFYGNDGRNYLAGNRGDYLYGFGGNDLIGMNSAAAVIDGGDGTDRLSLFSSGFWLTPDTNGDGIAETAAAATAGWNVDLSAGTITDGYGNVGTVSGIENVDGNFMNDTLVGDSNANVFNGFDGDDILEGRGGNDGLDGGVGADTASYANASGAVTVNLFAGTASGGDGNDTLANIENIIGSAFADTLIGNGSANVLSGGDGLDTLLGFGGADILNGDGGADTLFGHQGNDTLNGGAGNDNLYGGTGDDVIDGGAGFNLAGYAPNAYDPLGNGVTVDLNLQGVAQNTGQGWDTLSNIQGLYGTQFNDTLTGDGNTNLLIAAGTGVGGAGGDDQLVGNGGDDLLIVGSGNVLLDGGTGDDTANFGAAGAPLLNGVTVSLALQGAAQATGSGSMTLTGIENLSGTGLADTLIGDGGNNALSGSGGDDLLIGGAGNDSLRGDAAFTAFSATDGSLLAPYLAPDASVFAGQAVGNDTLEGGLGNDLIDGGGGSDTASYANASGAVTVTLGAGGSGTSTGADGTDTLVSIENLLGGAFNDNLTGNGAANTLDGGGGHDRLNGGGGNDWLLGGTGDDTLTGGGGDDLIDGGAGYDRAAYFGATSGVTVNLGIAGAQNTGSAGIDTLVGIENLTGTQYSDTLTGDGGDNWLWGFATTAGTVNNDTLNGGGGNDLLWAGNGNMTLIGGSGNDTVMYNQNFSGDVAVTISLATAAAQNTGQGTWTLSGIENLVGGTANDVLTGDINANILCGAAGTDTLNGGAGNDTLYGDGTITFDDHGTGGSGPIILVGDAIPIYGGVAGNDNLNGGDGDDFLYGGAGNDFLKGDKDNDTLYGGTGNDTLVGGAGNDRYVIEASSGADTISGFTHVDRIVFDVASGVTSFSQLTMTAVGGTNTLITWGNGNSILVQGLRPRDMVASDFQFTTAAGFEHTPHDFATSWSVPHDPFL